MFRIFYGVISQRTSQACLVDSTPPTFAGIAGATPENSGSIEAQWALASDSNPPISYEVYIALGAVSAGVLFQPSNLVDIAPNGSTSKKVFTLGDGTTFLVKNQVYTLGVRARDALGNVEFNTVIQTATAIASGNMAQVYQDLIDDMETVIAEIGAVSPNFGQKVRAVVSAGKVKAVVKSQNIKVIISC